jgi:ribosomal-protein-serine acetyltransferase
MSSTLVAPRLLTDGIVAVTPFTLDDIDATYEAARESRNTVYPWLPWCHPKYSRDEAEQWINMVLNDEAHRYEMMILQASTGRFLGGVGLNQFSARYNFANLGYWIRTSAEGKGYATRAAKLLARFGIQELGLNRVEIIAAEGNVGSNRVAEKVGATREGILRKRLPLHGEVVNAVVYSLVASDFTL